MLKKTITYTDYDGNERTEDFYFNLTKAEVTEMELSVEGGLTSKIERVIAARNGKAIISIFKDIILMSYGEKSPDGKRFVKSEELRESFLQSPVYDIVFNELATDAKAAAAFVNSIIPQV